MVYKHRGVDVAPQDYHSVPEGWHADEIFRSHNLMRGEHPISDLEIRKPAALSSVRKRDEWLRYKETLDRIASGIRAGDAACSEIGIRYLELRYIGSYSGFIRAKIARALRSASLLDGQRDRLNKHFLELVFARDYTEEWREYWKLWGLIITEKILHQVVSYFEHRSDVEAPGWLPKMIAAREKTKRPAIQGN